MSARQRLMPRKESVLDNGKKTQPLSPGRTVTRAGAQTAGARWGVAWTRTGGLGWLRSGGTRSIISMSSPVGIWDLLDQ